MTILSTEEAIAHCRADPVEDAAMLAIYLGAAEEAAQDYIKRKVYKTKEDLDAANDESGMVANFAFKAAALLICGHLYLNREDVVTGVTVQALPMGAHDLLRPHRRSFGV